ncbi:MAG: lysylphosphatidylglycerol synthase transmembrane domain-containing protein [Vicinamibacterales bacterium]
MKRQQTGSILRVLVAVLLTAVVLWRSNPGRVLEVTFGADVLFVCLSVMLVLVDRTLMAWRWLVLIAPVADSPRPSLGAIMHVFFVSTFVGTFLGPVSLGGDAVRAFGLIRHKVAGSSAVASIFMDRMLGVLSVVALAVVGLVLARDVAREPLVLAALAAGTAATVVTAVFVFLPAAAQPAVVLAARLPGRATQRAAANLIGAVQKYGRARCELAAVLCASLAVQALRVVQAWLLGISLGITAPAYVYFAFIPLILLVMLLPVTVLGLGTSQWAFVWFFGRAGIEEPAAFALSVLFIALGIVGNLPGAFLFARDGLHGRHPAGESHTAR